MTLQYTPARTPRAKRASRAARARAIRGRRARVDARTLRPRSRTEPPVGRIIARVTVRRTTPSYSRASRAIRDRDRGDHVDRRASDARHGARDRGARVQRVVQRAAVDRASIARVRRRARTRVRRLARARAGRGRGRAGWMGGERSGRASVRAGRRRGVDDVVHGDERGERGWRA